MRQRQEKQKHENITLSFPHDLNVLLRSHVSSRGISSYVANAVRQALEKDKNLEMKKLEAAYEKANKDPDRKKVLRELKVLDSVDDIEGWEW